MSYKLNNLIYIFIITAFLGWVMETIGSGLYYKMFIDCGAITFPVCIIYGCAICLMYLLFKTPHEGLWKKIRKKIKNKYLGWTLTLAVYFVMVFLLSFAIEYYTGFFIDKLGLEKQWDYSMYKDNLHGYIRWSFLVYFGLGGTFYMLIIFPFLYRQAAYSKRLSITMTNILFMCIIIYEYLIRR